MSASLRRQRVLAILVAVIMVVAAFQPMVKANAKPVPDYRPISGKAQGPVGFAKSQPLNMLAQKMSKAQTDWPTPITPDQAPVQQFLGGRQIPHKIVAQPKNVLNLPNRTPNDGAGQGGEDEGETPPLVDVTSPGLDKQWAGLSQGVNRAWYSYGVYPPDTQGDASLDYYIQVVNIQMEIWDLNQTTQYTGTPLPLYVGPIDTLWKGSGLTACENSEDGDPVVVYDEYADRWVLTQFALPNFGVPGGPYYECIAVSQSGNPMDAWNLYQYSFPVMNDYPKFGVWSDGYYMTINQFDPSDSTNEWRGEGVAVFDKGAMQSGNPNARMIYINTHDACVTGTEPECFLGGMLPADADGTTAPTGPEVYMQFDDDAWGYSPDQLQLWTLVPDWTAGTASFTHLVDLTTDPFDSEVCAGYDRDCIPQNGTAQGLDAISDRLMYRLQWRDFGTYQAMVVNQTINVATAPASQAGIRWYQLTDGGTGGTTWSINQQGTVAPDSKNRWMGSIAMDAVGNISLGYSVSDATMYPGIRYSVHLASDPANTMRAESNMVTGGGAQTGSGARWGDYSMMSVLPGSIGVGDGCTYIYTQEYLRGTTAAEWSTWLGVFHNASCVNNDVTAPETQIDSKTFNGADAQFAFSGSDDTAVASYECSLDGSTFATCTSPKSYANLTSGDHTFEVRAVDTSKNVDATPATFSWTNASFASVASYDGWMRESAAGSGIGGAAGVLGYMKVGDDLYNRQYKSILSFNTSTLPDTAVVAGASVYVARYSVTGVDPTLSLGNFQVDIAEPYFGTGVSLAKTDFQDTPSQFQAGVATFGPLSGKWYTAALTDGFGFINLLGTTQFRIYFQTASNLDKKNNVLNLYSGNSVAAYRPVLVVNYYIP